MAEEIISYFDLAKKEGGTIQHGMNYRYKKDRVYSVFLMSTRQGSPYNDKITNDGKAIVYEGHDVSKRYIDNNLNPKELDQPAKTPSGKLTPNGKFLCAVEEYANKERKPELIRVYQKLAKNKWIYLGIFKLIDAWKEKDEKRYVFKFKLEIVEKKELYQFDKYKAKEIDVPHERQIPSDLRYEVWKRDKGRCIICGSNKNIHIDHIIPFSKGGVSINIKNLRLLCAKHNLEKSDKIDIF